MLPNMNTKKIGVSGVPTLSSSTYFPFNPAGTLLIFFSDTTSRVYNIAFTGKEDFLTFTVDKAALEANHNKLAFSLCAPFKDYFLENLQMTEVRLKKSSNHKTNKKIK